MLSSHEGFNGTYVEFVFKFAIITRVANLWNKFSFHFIAIHEYYQIDCVFRIFKTNDYSLIFLWSRRLILKFLICMSKCKCLESWNSIYWFGLIIKSLFISNCNFYCSDNYFVTYAVILLWFFQRKNKKIYDWNLQENEMEWNNKINYNQLS